MKILWYFLYYFSLHTVWTRCFFFSFFFFVFSLGFFSTTPFLYPTPFLYLPSFSFSSSSFQIISSSLSLSLSLYFFYFYFYFLSSLAHFTHTQPADMAFVYLFLKKKILYCFDSLCCYNGAQIGFHALDLLFSF